MAVTGFIVLGITGHPLSPMRPCAAVLQRY
jgi:hypothetical protein